MKTTLGSVGSGSIPGSARESCGLLCLAVYDFGRPSVDP